MKSKIFCLALVLSLCLSGCSLARPEKEEDYEDVFCGFYAVAEQMDTEGQIRSDFYDNPALEVYGSESMKLDGIGNVAFDREVLFGVTDEAGNVTFPGMKKGYRLLLYTYNENGYPVSAVQSDMGPGEEGTQIKHTDEGAYMSASGVIYVGPPLGAGPDWSEQDTGTIWTLYRVYQTRDGRFYMDGSGNSYGGAGGMTVNEDQTYRSTRNGETEEETTVSITVEVRQVERLEQLTVYQYGGDGALGGGGGELRQRWQEAHRLRPGGGGYLPRGGAPGRRGVRVLCQPVYPEIARKAAGGATAALLFGGKTGMITTATVGCGSVSPRVSHSTAVSGILRGR